MIPVDEAIALLLSQSKCLVGPETVRTADSTGRTLAADLVSPIDVPPADNSAMDG